MIAVKTKMSKLPATCKECELHVVALNMIGCPILTDWIEPFQFRRGKTKFDNCPLEIIENAKV